MLKKTLARLIQKFAEKVLKKVVLSFIDNVNEKFEVRSVHVREM